MRFSLDVHRRGAKLRLFSPLEGRPMRMIPTPTLVMTGMPIAAAAKLRAIGRVSSIGSVSSMSDASSMSSAGMISSMNTASDLHRGSRGPT